MDDRIHVLRKSKNNLLTPVGCPDRRNFWMLTMNATTTKTADALLVAEPRSASTTGLMLSFARAARAVSEWSRRRRTITELNALTDRELRDIGLTRGEIGHYARRPLSRPRS